MFVRLQENVYIRQVEEESVVCSPRSGACLIIRDVGKFLRELHTEWRHMDDIKNAIANHFGVTLREVDEDVEAVVKELFGQGLVAVKNTATEIGVTSESDGCPVWGAVDDCAPLEDFYLKHGIPAELHLDLTDACTERCVHCYVPRGQHHYLPYKHVEKAILEFRALQGLSVHLTGGECMMHPDFERVCRLCKSLNINIIIFSNMTCCDMSRVDFLRKIEPQFINVSLYSMIPDEHDAITQLPGSWQKTMTALIKCNEVGVPCRIATPVLRRNRNACKELKKFADEHHMHFVPNIDIIAGSDHNCENLQSKCSESEMRSLLRADPSLFSSDRARGATASEDKVCGIGMGRLYLSAQGKYYPCDSMHGYVLGDVLDNTIEEVWHGSKLNYLRGLKNRDFRGCASCADRQWCKICPAANYNANKDLFEPPSGACEFAKMLKEMYGRA